MFWEPNTIEAGLIASGVTLLGILITNQAKVSEFRQQWINALREDAATLITHSLILHSASGDEHLEESYSQIHQTTARIRLRLNPKEKKSLAVISAMNSVRDANHSAVAFPDMNQRLNDFTIAVQNVLKSEWRRVKFGEPLYRVVFILVIISVLFFLRSFLRQKFHI